MKKCSRTYIYSITRAVLSALFLLSIWSNSFASTISIERVNFVTKDVKTANAITLADSGRTAVSIYADIAHKVDEKLAVRLIEELEEMIIPKMRTIIDFPKEIEKVHVIFEDINLKGVYGFYAPQKLGKSIILLDINFTSKSALFASLAHEFFHVIQHYYDDDEVDFVKEGTALIVERLLYGRLHMRGISNYLSNSDNNLTDFNFTQDDYANSYLFFTYLIENFGDHKFLADLIIEKLDGIEGIENVLRSNNMKFYGKDLTFDTAFVLYSIAKAINRGKSHYNLPEVVGLSAANSKLSNRIVPGYSSLYFSVTQSSLQKINEYNHPSLLSYFVGLTKNGEIKAFSTSHELLEVELEDYRKISWVVINNSSHPIVLDI